MPLALFDSQMRALSEAGYQAISCLRAGPIAKGESPPERPILITFSTTRASTPFELADPSSRNTG
jgi:hypothetical protein